VNRYLTRDNAAILAALVAPLAAAAILLPFRANWPNTNVALLLVVVVVAVAGRAFSDSERASSGR
jgi:membrane protein implicated in regulation of membrane protease activity